MEENIKRKKTGMSIYDKQYEKYNKIQKSSTTTRLERLHCVKGNSLVKMNANKQTNKNLFVMTV